MAPSIIGAPTRAQTSHTGDPQFPAPSGALGPNLQQEAKKGRGQYYTPAAIIRDVPGVAKGKSDHKVDRYIGTAEALVAAGLATLEMFPGQPGRLVGIARYRPVGEPPKDSSWCFAPGYMSIRRRATGDFCIELTVPRAEQDRRRAALNARELAAAEERRVARREQRARVSNQFRAGDRARLFDVSNKGVLVVLDEALDDDDGDVEWAIRAVRDPLVTPDGRVLRLATAASSILRPIDYLRVIDGGRTTKREASHA